MKLLARAFSTLTTSQVCAGHGSLEENEKKKNPPISDFFFMPLFTGHISSGVVHPMHIGPGVVQVLGKNEKCQCPPGAT